MNSTTATAGPKGIDRAFLAAAAAIVFGVLAMYLSQMQVLGMIPLKNLLKNSMGASREAAAAFFFWATFVWNLKPLVGIVQDAWPLFGSRRRSYLLVAGLLSALAWWSLLAAPREYHVWLIICILINVVMVVGSTAIGGFMVEVAQSSASAGRLTALRSSMEYGSYLVSGPAAGLLAGIAFAWTAVTCGAIAFLGVPVALWLMRDKVAQRRPDESAQVFAAAGARFLQVARSRAMWVAAAVALLFYFSPGILTAQFYAQQNDLHLSTQQQGTLLFLNGGFGVLAALGYAAFLARRFTLRWLLFASILLGACGQASYVLYSLQTWNAARVADSFNGLTYALAEVAMMHLAVRATPKGCEALGFALLMAVRNFGLYGGDWLGSAIQDHRHLGFPSMALINAAVSLLAVPLLLLLPAAVADVRDAQRSTAEIDLTPAPREI